ncbi:Hypothetical predicted protein [Lecanosticta acicola]|uniref:Heterokaryon incompatibility domain-containing protein n=1 Tax=Lecanosticta acicola TaxID=111012 RepID=A0AAI8Z4P7_9PEZI|nr:Hypothetical predicted protein [Lecanosticta acicola]
MGFRDLFSTLGSTGTTPTQNQSPGNPTLPNATPSRAPRGEYQYTRLAPTQIRLMQLLPGSGLSKIKITVETVPFGPNDQPEFQALSYTWGSDEHPGVIQVAGGRGIIKVGRNLLQALHSLRRQGEARRMWIDAICINQKDAEERSEQVNLMANVYERAHGVIAWIGRESASSTLALRTMSSIGEHVQADWETPDVRVLHPRSGLPAKQLNAVLELLRRPYFQRLWVYQELHLGGEGAVVLCGQDVIPWQAVRTTVLLIRARYRQSPGFRAFPPERWRYLLHLCDSDYSRREFLDSLHRTRLAECSDDRDRVFSVLSLFSKGHNYGITKEKSHGIDRGYTKTIQEVYVEVITMHLKTTGSLEFLNYTGRPKHQDLPSWVPDWSREDPSVVFQGLAAGPQISDLPFTLSQDQPRRLRTPALIVGQIAHASPNFDFPPAILARILSASGAQLLEALTRSLYGNYFCENNVDARHEARTAHMSFYKQEREIHHELHTHGRLVSEQFRIQGHRLGRSLLVTAGEGLGLGPSATLPNDHIAVFPNCSSAVILRPTTTSTAGSNRYTVVGPAYVEGCMQTEAFLGPLPDRVERMSKLEKGGKPKVLFYDHNRKVLLAEDPRLGPLPRGWRRGKEGGFENKQTGECRTSVQDPRLDMEMLRRRGVQFREIELV